MEGPIINFPANVVPPIHFAVPDGFSNAIWGLNRASVLYAESHYTPLFNRYIQVNIGAIQELFSQKGLDFVYVPQLIADWERNLNDLADSLLYELPTLAIEWLDSIPQITTTDLIKPLLSGMTAFDNSGNPIEADQDKIGAGLLRYTGNEYSTGGRLFSLSLFDNLKSNELFSYFNFYANDVYRELNPVIDYDDISLSPLELPEIPSDDSFADASFENEAHRIAAEITDKISLLKQRGYKRLLLRIIAQSLTHAERIQLASLSDNTIPVSSLVITKDYRIMLPGFNNLEVKMTPLPKAVFLLFLRYPEGILLKHLPEYRKELLAIYQQIAYRETPEEVQRSINELTNPRSNSINEKCSRIKEAFVKLFDDTTAEHYYVTGQRAAPKRIAIASSPDLLIWEVDLKSIK